VTGTPGVGKSSISKMLALKLKVKYISLGEIVKKEGLYTELDIKRDSLIVDMEKIVRRVDEQISDSKKDIIIEGHYSVDVVSPKKINVVFVLRRNPCELKGILKKRNYKEEKIIENLIAEILDVCLYEAIERCGIDKVCEFDVTGKDFSDVLKEILLVLNEKKGCRVGLVDWLGELESQGILGDYIKEF
jgi:adenylate kinase